MALSTIFDHAQKRLSQDRISVIAAGYELNGYEYQHTFIDPVTNTLMLRPGPLYDAWYTLNTGIYAKYAKADLTFETAANWSNDYSLATVAAGPWLSSNQAAAGWLMTPSLGKNRGIYLSIFNYSAGDNFVLAEFGWGNNPVYNLSGRIGLRLYSGGDLEIWKDASLVGVYNVSGAISGTNIGASEYGLLLIPGRRRELIVLSRNGNGFSHVFDDIEESDTDPVITPAGVFWVDLPTATAKIQIAPLQYNVTGYATSDDFQLSEAPSGTDTLETFTNAAFAGGAGQNFRIYGDPPFGGSPTTTTQASLIGPTGSAFVANSVNKSVRIKATLTGDGAYTPFVYGAQIAYAAILENTADEETDLTPWIESVNLEVPDDPTSVSVSLSVIGPEDAEGTVPDLRLVTNRPVKVSLTHTLIDGVGEAPEWDMSTSDASQRARLEVRDRWKALENYMFRERQVLDGYRLKDALTFCLLRAGLEAADLDLDDPDFYLDDIPQDKAGDFNVVIEIGDTAAEWIQRLIEDYAATYHWGFEPTTGGIKFVFKSPETLDLRGEAITLYASRQDAIDDGILEVDAWKHVFRSFTERRLEPEANDIRVTGWDPRSRRPIQSHYPDESSQDPTLAVASRPENWLGEPRRYGLLEPAINSQDVCDRAATLLFERLTPVQRLAEITCEFLLDSDLIPIWRGRDIKLDGQGRYRVLSLRSTFDHEYSDITGWRWREASYCLRRVGD